MLKKILFFTVFFHVAFTTAYCQTQFLIGPSFAYGINLRTRFEAFLQNSALKPAYMNYGILPVLNVGKHFSLQLPLQYSVQELSETPLQDWRTTPPPEAIYVPNQSYTSNAYTYVWSSHYKLYYFARILFW
jgi:hypothetical protein